MRKPFDALLTSLPQHKHCQILWVGEAYLSQRPAVGANDLACCVIQREAQLLVEIQGGIRHHAKRHWRVTRNFDTAAGLPHPLGCARASQSLRAGVEHTALTFVIAARRPLTFRAYPARADQAVVRRNRRAGQWQRRRVARPAGCPCFWTDRCPPGQQRKRDS